MSNDDEVTDPAAVAAAMQRIADEKQVANELAHRRLDAADAGDTDTVAAVDVEIAECASRLAAAREAAGVSGLPVVGTHYPRMNEIPPDP